jgi:hypothetical protein
MNQHDLILEVLEAREARRADRRRFIKVAGAAAAVTAGASMLAGCNNDDSDDFEQIISPSPTPTPPAITDADILNFALNLEYLEAQFYSYAATGAGLPVGLLGGTGTQGAVTGGRQVAFTDPLVAQYAREIAADEQAHVAFLRRAIGTTAVSQPAIDIGTSATGAFSTAARAAGLIGAGATFDPYSSDENFLLGAFIFEDVGVTAYKGSAALITNKTYLEAAAGILGVEAYHAAIIRSTLYRKGVSALIKATRQIAEARDSLDGVQQDDQGVQPRTVDGFGTLANIAPTDANGIVFSRSAAQVLNVVYLNSDAVTMGGFFPRGVNGNIKTSAASTAPAA